MTQSVINENILKVYSNLKALEAFKFDREFCAVFDIDYTRLNKIQLGMLNFTIDNVYSVCSKLNIDANWIIGVGGKEPNYSNAKKLFKNHLKRLT